jgi:hypothetical protein
MAFFTAGQVTRMRATLEGPRSAFQLAEPTPAEAGWKHTDLTAATGAPEAAGDPTVFESAGGVIHVMYRGVDEHVHHLSSSVG